MTNSNLENAAHNAMSDVISVSFNIRELQEFCRHLGVDPENLGGHTKNEKALELVLYCHRRSQFPELVAKFTQERPDTPLPSEILTYLAEIERLDRSGWLRNHSFEIDPFSMGAFKFEFDPLFSLHGMSASVDPPHIEQLIGRPDTPGYRFIFATSGGGKTTLRRRIFNKFKEDLEQWHPNKVTKTPLVLPIEYIDHSYSSMMVDEEAHIRRIAHLISRDGLDLLLPRLPELKQEDFRFDLEQPLNELIQDIFTAIQRWQLDGICVLIDNLDGQRNFFEEGWEFISPFATYTVDHMPANGLMFKFFCPIEFFPPARSVLPDRYLYRMQWNETQLRVLLEKRLSLCRKQEDSIAPSVFPIENKVIANIFHLDQSGSPDHITAELIKFGQEYNAPAKMWQLGHYVLEEHFKSYSDQRQPANTLIQHEALKKAVAYLRAVVNYPASASPEIVDRTAVNLQKISETLEKFCQTQVEEYNCLSSLVKTSSEMLTEAYSNFGNVLDRLISAVDNLAQVIQETRNLNDVAREESGNEHSQ